VLPADQRDRQRRATFVQDLNRALDLAEGHFDSAWMVDHLQFGVDSTLLVTAFSAAVGMFFGICPAMRAPSLARVEALRYE
jgi:hypothetical protein